MMHDDSGYINGWWWKQTGDGRFALLAGDMSEGNDDIVYTFDTLAELRDYIARQRWYNTLEQLR